MLFSNCLLLLFKRKINYIKFLATTEGCHNPLIYKLELVGHYYTLISRCNQKDASTPCESGHNLMSAQTLCLLATVERILCCPVIYQPQLKGRHNALCRLRPVLAPPYHPGDFLGHYLKVSPITLKSWWTMFHDFQTISPCALNQYKKAIQKIMLLCSI